MLYRREINFLHQFLKFTVGYLIILVFLSVGLQIVERDQHWSFLDAFYQIVITVSTVGFGEVKPLSDLGRIYIIGVIFLQTGFFVYITSKIVDLAVSGELKEIINYRRLQLMLRNMENHTVLVGLGKLGSSVIETLLQLGEQVVVIDRNSDLVKLFSKRYPSVPFIDCDAKEEDCLKQAKIDRARYLILTTSSDAENLFILVTARDLNENLKIVSRVSNPANAKKFIQAGASEVFLPEVESGKILATILEKPNVSKLLNLLLLEEDSIFDLEEVDVKPCSPIVGKSVGQIFKGNLLGVLLAIKRGETFLILPAKEEVIKSGDILVVMGTVEQISQLYTLVDC